MVDGCGYRCGCSSGVSGCGRVSGCGARGGRVWGLTFFIRVG